MTCSDDKFNLKNALVNIFGLKVETVQQQLKGDKYIRETVCTRPKDTTIIDDNINKIQEKLLRLLLETGVTEIEICFNNSEIITRRIFDPLSREVHYAESFLQNSYINTHFPPLKYDTKNELVRQLYTILQKEPFDNYLTQEWKDALKERNDNWQEMPVIEIRGIIASIKELRSINDYYLKKIIICIVQKVVEMVFNCDGTTILASSHFETFMDENL